MVDATAIYGGNYLNAGMVRSEKLIGKPLTINDARTETFREVEKIVLSFKEIEKELPINKTNAKLLIEAYGKETNGWSGKNIMLQVTKRMFQGSLVDAIEVVPQ